MCGDIDWCGCHINNVDNLLTTQTIIIWFGLFSVVYLYITKTNYHDNVHIGYHHISVWNDIMF